MTALRAMTNIPPERATKIVRIEGREGSPTPERWYVITYDPQSESGFREYAVAIGGQAQARTVSQFVESVSPEEVIPMPAIKLDSDQAYKQLEVYASAHGLGFSKVNYVLTKDKPDAAPIWKLTCVDDAERPLATLTMTAADGKIVAQSGFTPAPVAAGKKTAEDAAFLRKTEVAANQTPERNKQQPTSRATENGDSVIQPAGSSVEEKENKVSTTKSEPKKQQASAKNPRKSKSDWQTTGSGARLQNFFTGRSPI